VEQASAVLRNLNVAQFWPLGPVTRLDGEWQAGPVANADRVWHVSGALSNRLPRPWNERGLPLDRLAAVISEAPAGAIDVTGARTGAEAVQVVWRPTDLPDQAVGLAALDLIVISDADTSALTERQRSALRTWVTGGGHLIVSGGAAWQATAAGLDDLLPLTPTRTIIAATLAPLGEWLRLPPARIEALEQPSLLAIGDLATAGRILTLDAVGTPLIARRALAAGTVDYLAFDLGAAPLHGWDGLADLITALHTARPPVPGWARGFTDWPPLQNAVEILPGFDPLPALLPLLLFLAAYLLLIGPLNYWVLERLNKREWAWVTIPLIIGGFSVGAYTFGTSIRGTDATLNQLSVIQSFPNESAARLDSAIGMLAPRRGQYTLTVAPGWALRTIPPATPVGSGLFTSGAQTALTIEQAERFAAVDFAVDASFVAGFAHSGVVDAPAVRGSAAFTYAEDVPGQLVGRGSVTNDLAVPLHDPVLLARGISLRLPADLTPGAVEAFTLTLPGTSIAAGSPALPSPVGFTFRRGQPRAADQSAVDVIGGERYVADLFRPVFAPAPEQQAAERDTLFLNALVDDPLGSTGRGDAVYVAGWVDDLPLGVALIDVGWETTGRTWIIAQMETHFDTPPSPVTIAADRFTWAIGERSGLSETYPDEIALQPGDQVSYRFTPLPDAQLSEVTAVRLLLPDLSVTTARRIPLEVWNWRAGAWDSFVVSAQSFTLPTAAAYVGPFNAVQVRLTTANISTFLRLGRLAVEQEGRL